MKNQQSVNTLAIDSTPMTGSLVALHINAFKSVTKFQYLTTK